ncbi:hypothetical protein FB567DRAFT_575814 [Paraphoma chrysanthemicola]|uniref:Uncharacterized protein n=1 Tax=Paraphoma chrysanthemicola TaxID=798071 RepID=A0A8K0W333_9PLEO|nr:hypothetical protein FB567DRAFT_575814 [Paraphoma chrysanthemicola]
MPRKSPGRLCLHAPSRSYNARPCLGRVSCKRGPITYSQRPFRQPARQIATVSGICLVDPDLCGQAALFILAILEMTSLVPAAPTFCQTNTSASGVRKSKKWSMRQAGGNFLSKTGRL